MLRAEQKLAEHQLRHAVAGHAVDRVSAQAALLADLPAPMVHTGGLSSALHDAGPMSALKRARALLDTLNDMDRHRPAA
jgi:hypothetical protein